MKRTKPMKRTRLNRQSKKTRANIAAHRAQRVEWSKDHNRCMVCGKHQRDCWPGLETHEILRGSLRSAAVVEPSCWLRLCPTDHAGMDYLSHRAGIIKQVAIKVSHDAEHFNLDRFNSIMERKYQPVTLTELREALDAMEGNSHA